MKSNRNDGSKLAKKKKEYKQTKQFMRKRERTKKAILKAAEEFYSGRSMDEVVLDDIAEAAFVSRTTIYNYFKNKDDIFFALGNNIIKHENETIATILPAELSGKEQVLFLCEKTFKDSIDKPIILKITREFFSRLNRMKSSVDEIYSDITEKLGASTLNDLVENRVPLENVKLDEFFEEPFFIEFFIQGLKNGYLWAEAIKKGKEDNTIKNQLEELHIAQYVNMLLSGMVSEIELRNSVLDRMKLKRDTIITNSLNLIALFLDNKSGL